jgi:eukaryotic-like serine/threonine-protein kinase
MSDASARQRAQAWVGKSLRGKWDLHHLVGTGGMANVYAARHHRNGREVAIKLLLPEFAQYPEVRERFLREGYIANRIDHPGVVGIMDDDETEDGLAFLVMELLQGVALLELLDARTLTLPEALFVADQLLDVLGAAHRASVVHRDIKPGNVFILSDGRVKVLDFGLARVLEGQAQALTREGLVLGTVSYMAPEQARAEAGSVDARSDIYAVGSTLFMALSGEFVHVARNVMDRLRAVTSVPARSIGSVVSRLPPRVVALIDRALQFHPDDRWQDAQSMQNEVREAFREITRQEIPKTQRVKMHGIEGWSRPATPAVAINAVPTGEATYLEVSVVFESESSQDGLSIPIEVVDV